MAVYSYMCDPSEFPTETCVSLVSVCKGICPKLLQKTLTLEMEMFKPFHRGVLGVDKHFERHHHESLLGMTAA